MKKLASIATILVLAAPLWVPTVSSAGAVNADAQLCMKAKDIGDPIPMLVSPNPAVVNALALGGTNCTLIKLAQVCMPSDVNDDTAVSTSVASCCYRVKCDPKLPRIDSMNLEDDEGGSGMFTGRARLIKPAQLCFPCEWSIQP